MTGLAVVAAVVLAYSLVSRRPEPSAVSAPMVFVAAGIVTGPDVLDLSSWTRRTARPSTSPS